VGFSPSPDLAAALNKLWGATPPAIQRLKLELARLALEQAPPGSGERLELVEAWLSGRDVAVELREARQDCWAQMGSQACGCSPADAASAQCVLVCLDDAPVSHTLASLAEQCARLLSCGVSSERIVSALRRGLQLLLVVLVVCAASRPAVAAPKREPPLLFGGAVSKPKLKPTLDPRLPTGTLLRATSSRPKAGAARCSFTRPVCVHAPLVLSALLPESLSLLEQAYERLVLALRLPAPVPDFDAGGSDALDWYVGFDAAELAVEQEALLPGRMDAAPVFCRSAATSGALLARDASLCVGEAMASALDAGEAPEIRRALALELWWITGSKTTLDVQILADAQRHPEQALARDGPASPASVGSFALLLEMLETTRSVASPGTLTASLLSAAASRTPAGAARYDNEPDVFDVLRHSLDEEMPRYADLLVDFALRRALTGDREDGTRLPSLAYAGSFARAHFDWVIKYSSLPRRVLSGLPVAQSGVELIWVELDEAPLGAGLGLRAEWEAPVAFQWRMLLIDAEGREVRRMNVTFQERATSADGRVLRLDGAKALIIAGVNLGGVELAHPFDPDVAPFEPAGCTVYLAGL
jgi:hypothetical protein